MALLGEIRKRPIWLIVGIGLPLVAFLIGDAFSQGNVFGNPNELGSVAGHPINIQDYNQTYNRLSKSFQSQEVSENQLSEMTWNQLISERLIAEEVDDLGLNVDENKYFEEAGRFYRTVNPELVDEAGKVNIEKTKAFLSELKTMAQSGNPQAQNFYEQWENANPQSRLLANAFTSLVSSGALATDVDAAFQNNANSENQIQFVGIKYEDYLKNNKIEVSDDEILAYMKSHKKAFKQQPSVNLAYAFFSGSASSSDESLISKELSSYLAPQIIKDQATGAVDSISSFAAAKNDSAFVSRFTDSQFDPTYYTKEQFESFPDNLKTPLMSAVKGSVIGPVKVGEVLNLIKVSDVKPINDSIKTSHILIGYAGSAARAENITRTPEQAKVLADSLYAAVKANPALFNTYASANSDDPVAAADNGSIGWVGRFQQGFDQNYLKYAVENLKGSIGLVPSQFGYHIIRIDDTKTKTGYQLATIQKEIKASADTQQNLFTKANTLAISSQGKSANDFINAARKEGAEVNNSDGTTRFQSNLVGLQGTGKEADILKWAFSSDTKPGSVQSFETSNGGQIIAYLSNRFDKDQYNVAAARANVEPILQHKKIAEAIAAANTTTADLNAIATKYGTTVKTANVTYSNPALEEFGREPKVGGAAMGLAQGKTSSAIEGNTAVYFVKVVSKAPAAAKTDYKAEKKGLQMQYKNQLQSQVIQSLVDAADIKDSRADKLK